MTSYVLSYKKIISLVNPHSLKMNSWKKTLHGWKPKVSRGGIYVKGKADFKLKILKF